MAVLHLLPPILGTVNWPRLRRSYTNSAGLPYIGSSQSSLGLKLLPLPTLILVAVYLCPKVVWERERERCLVHPSSGLQLPMHALLLLPCFRLACQPQNCKIWFIWLGVPIYFLPFDGSGESRRLAVFRNRIANFSRAALNLFKGNLKPFKRQMVVPTVNKFNPSSGFKCL